MQKRQYRKYTDEDIIKNSKNVTTLSELLRSLDLVCAGGNFANMKRNLQRLNVDTSHWKGMAWSKDEQRKNYNEYTRNAHLKKHLINDRGHMCEICKNTTWLNKPIVLELHHIDGNRTHNESKNVQLLCPNCHSTTDNWRGRK